MRVFFALAVIILVVAALVSAGAPTFTNCGAPDALLQNVQFTTDTPVWNSGSTVHFTVTGTLSESFSGGLVGTTAYFDGIEVINKEEPICSYEGSPFKCPEAAGQKSWTFPFAIDSVPWSGTLEAHSLFTSENGKQIFCLDTSVSL